MLVVHKVGGGDQFPEVTLVLNDLALPKLATIRQAAGRLTLTTGYNRVAELDPRLEPSASFRTLRVYLSPSGTFNHQTQILYKHAETCKEQL